MAKDSRIRPTNLPLRSDRVNPTQLRDEKISFNFRHLHEKDKKFLYSRQSHRYFIKVLERFKAISNLTRKEMATQSDGLRFHKINFGESNVSETEMGIKNCQGEDVNDEAYQFQICANAHGRVHGYFIGSTFYIVWLDPDHELYPGKK